VSDLDALIALERAAFKTEPLSRRSLRHFLASARVTFVVAEDDGNLAGYVLVRYPSRTLARVYSIAVNPNLQGQGLGQCLLAVVDEKAKRHHCRAIRLEVRKNDARAITFYEKWGYHPFGKRRCYYDGRVDALLLEKPLGKVPPGNSRIRHKPA
jgi:ribosomal-protein-alanine acetyltransferase